MNALAYAPSEGLIDLYGGMKDIEAGVIRCIRRPEDRFQEDALRILRALRFASVMGYRIETETAAAIHRFAGNLKAISVERCAAELSRLILGAHATEVLLAYADVIAVILPVIQPMRGFITGRNTAEICGTTAQNRWHARRKSLPCDWRCCCCDCAKPDYAAAVEKTIPDMRNGARRLQKPLCAI